ncbi:MAG: nicotinate phosphoribosyltransferase, partial [Acidimicrobiales bacterium]
RIIVTGDLDDAALRALAGAPVDAYGVGTNVVTGLGAPTAGFVYKLVALGAEHHAVAKQSPGKATVGGRKGAWRVGAGGPDPHDLVGPAGSPGPPGARPLLHRVVDGGAAVGERSLEEISAWHDAVRPELARATALGLERL